MSTFFLSDVDPETVKRTENINKPLVPLGEELGKPIGQDLAEGTMGFQQFSRIPWDFSVPVVFVFVSKIAIQVKKNR